MQRHHRELGSVLWVVLANSAGLPRFKGVKGTQEEKLMWTQPLQEEL